MKPHSFLTLFVRTIGSSVAALLLTAVYSVLSARLLGPDGRGVLASVQLWPTVLAGCMTIGLQTAFVYNARRDRARAAELFAAGLVATALVSLLTGLVGWRMLGHALVALNHTQLQFARIYLLAVLPAIALSIYIGGCAQLIDDLRLFNALKIVPLALQVLAILVLQFTLGLSAERMAVAAAVTQFLAVAWSLREAVRAFGFSLRQTWTSILLLAGFGVSVWAVEVLGVVTQQIDKIWISGALPLRDLGVYTLAYGVSRMIANIQNAAATIVFPRNVGRPKEDVVANISQVFRLTFWPTLLGMLPLSLLAIPLFPLIFGADFTVSGHMFPLLVLECILSTSSWVLAQAFNALGKPHLIVVRQLLGVATTILIATFWVHRLGVWAVVLAMLAGALVRLVVTFAAFPAGLAVAVPKIFPQRAEIVMTIAALKAIACNTKQRFAGWIAP